MDITLNDTYLGHFEHVGDVDGSMHFESVQKAAAPEVTNKYLLDLGVKPGPAEPQQLEVNTVKWGVDQTGHLTGTAQFLAVRSHDVVKASLDGQTSEPAPGNNYRLAQVKVTFVGGTGPYTRASGTANVVAKLYNDGMSVGHIVGKVALT
jgi:hypothetical protein